MNLSAFRENHWTSAIATTRPRTRRTKHAMSWTAALSLLLVLAAALRIPDRADAAPIDGFTPIRMRGLLVPCAGAASSEENPLGLRDRQHRSTEDARRFYRKHYDRAESLGLRRIIWHMPAGYQESGMRGRFAVLSVMGERAEVWLEELARFRARNPDASVGVYISAFLPRTIDSWREEDILPPEPFNPADLRHVDMVHRTMRPLVEAGIREVWLDNSAPTEHRTSMRALADYLRLKFGLYVVFEGVPNIRVRGTTQRQLDWSVLSHYAAMGTHRLHLLRDPNRLWVIPEQAEVIAVLADHDINRSGGETPPTIEDVRSYIDRGMTLFSMKELYDDFLLME